MEYRLWRNMYREGYCVLRSPPIEAMWEMNEGLSRADDFPSDFACVMDPEFPKDIQLSDNLYGSIVPVVSARLKTVLEGVTTNRIEYLPVQIINHKGRVASSQYFLLHPLDVCDCIDKAASNVKWNEISKDLISQMDSMVLNHAAIPEDYSVFRVQFMGYNILVREDVIKALEAANLDGLAFLEIDTYTGIG